MVVSALFPCDYVVATQTTRITILMTLDRTVHTSRFLDLGGEWRWDVSVSITCERPLGVLPWRSVPAMSSGIGNDQKNSCIWLWKTGT